MLAEERDQLVAVTQLLLRQLGGGLGRRVAENRREGLALDYAHARERQRTGQRLFELADVQRPMVLEEQSGRLGSERHVGTLGSELAQESRNEQGNVFRTVAQRRQLQGHAAEPGEQVAPERSSPHHLVEVAVRRGHHAQIESLGPRPAHGQYLALLKDPEEGRLRGGRKISDLVQEERSAVGGANQTRVVPIRPGEGALPMTEELGLD